MRTDAGLFLWVVNMMDQLPNVQSIKHALTVTEQIKLLKARGLIVNNMTYAQHKLKYISYYRFQSYLYYYEIPHVENNKRTHIFKENVTFEKVAHLYVFDKSLRMLFLDAIERIEVAFRTVMNNVMSLKYNNHWYLEKSIFNRYSAKLERSYQVILNEIIPKAKRQHQDELFLKHYIKEGKYNGQDLPCWVLAEITTKGMWSKLYGLLHFEYKKAIAQDFGLPVTLFESWFHCLTILRNQCAHHGRVWNRDYAVKMKLPKSALTVLDQHKTSAMIFAMHSVLRLIAPESEWLSRLEMLITKYKVDIKAMGLTENWKEKFEYHADYLIRERK